MAENDKMSCQSPAEPAHHILIVEDSENSAATMEMTLSDIPGTSVLRAPTGLAALQIRLPNSGRGYRPEHAPNGWVRADSADPRR